MTSNSNNSAPQWAIDAAREYYNGLAYGTQQSEGFLSLNAPKLAAIISRHAPKAERVPINEHNYPILCAEIDDMKSEIARLREALESLVGEVVLCDQCNGTGLRPLGDGDCPFCRGHRLAHRETNELLTALEEAKLALS